MNISSNVSYILQKIAAGIVPECGGSGWRRVAFLNMTDPTQQCPDSWREYGQDSVRVCGRQISNIASCSSVEYSFDGEYAHVCGRIIGYQFGSPDGYRYSRRFFDSTPENEINEPYVDGVSVTYGKPRQHIWTLYGGLREYISGCCAPTGPTQPPMFIDQSYFCDTGNPPDQTQNWRNTFFTSFPLWDSDTNCPSDANCCAPHSGPWFYTILMAYTTADIEIRICGDEGTGNEDTPLKVIEIYVM